MKSLERLLLIIILAAALTGCAATPEPAAPAEPAATTEPPATEEVATEPTEEMAAEPTAEMEAVAEATAETATGAEAPASAEGLTCAEPIQVGLISDLTGALSIYGTMTERSFLLGMEYATGSAPDAENTFTLGDCQIQVIVGDDKSDPENTATVAREMVEVNGVDILVGTVSSGATATLQEVARDNNIVHIAAPAAANDITGVNFDEHTFRTSRNNYQDAVNLCQYLTTEYHTFVQIAPDYSFGWGGAQAFRDACTTFGGEFAADDIFAPLDTTEFTPYMEQIFTPEPTPGW